MQVLWVPGFEMEILARNPGLLPGTCCRTCRPVESGSCMHGRHGCREVAQEKPLSRRGKEVAWLMRLGQQGLETPPAGSVPRRNHRISCRRSQVLRRSGIGTVVEEGQPVPVMVRSGQQVQAAVHRPWNHTSRRISRQGQGSFHSSGSEVPQV
jgi:hypothetical protein